VSWLWQYRIPYGKVTLIAGRPGVGKSWLVAEIAARVSTGAPWPDQQHQYREPKNVVLMCAEDDLGDTIRPRLDALQADCQRIYALQARRSGKGDVPLLLDDVDVIEKAIEDTKAQVLIIDPIGSYIGSTVDTHRDSEVRAQLSSYLLMAARKQIALILVAHVRKGGALIADEAVLGSVGYVGLARSVIHVGRDPDDRDRVLVVHGKNNLGPTPSPLSFRICGEPVSLVWETEATVDIDPDTIHTIVTADRGRPPSERSMAIDWLADVLANGPLSAQQIRVMARDAGLAMTTVRRAAATLRVKLVRVGYPSQTVWALPDYEPDVIPE
jgi:hypothetical protein